MAKVTDQAHDGPRCVARLLGRLDQAAQGMADDVPLGPYLLDALIEDAALCPALEPVGTAAGAADNNLESALRAAQRAAALVRSCPTMQRDWAVTQLHTAIEEARRILTARTRDDDPASLASALQSPRCGACPFA